MSDKAIAILSYFSFPGWIVALFLNTQRRSLLAEFHLRQSLGIMSTGTAIILAAGFSGIPEVSIFSFVLVFGYWLVGLIGAVTASLKPIPILGERFQKWFAGI